MTGLFSLLLDASLRIGIAGLLIGAVLFAARVQSSSLRHKVWLAVLCAMPLMLLLPRVAPSVEVSMPQMAVVGSFPAPVISANSSEAPAMPAASAIDKPATSPSRVSSSKSFVPLLLAVYGAGVVLFLARILSGWILARRLLRASRVTCVDGVTIHECQSVCSPLTVGIFAQRILFPENWTDWPEVKRRAILAHELAHVQRRDTAANFLAHLNRCIFWFHPLAWWVERQLAVTAEEICDDAGVLAAGGSRKYAEVLMDVAKTARRRSQRLAFQGVGVDGSGLLTRRIDRLLRDTPDRAASVRQQVLVATVCAGAIFAAAACQQKSVAALKPDPAYAKQIATSVASNRTWQEIAHISAADAEALEASVGQDRENVSARQKLMQFYQSRGREVLGDEKTIKGFWSLQLWCIEHHPEDSCSWSAAPLFDAVAFQQGAKLWDGVLHRAGVTPDEQNGAINYLLRADPQRAEQVARSASLDEKKLSQTLSRIYVSALGDATSQTVYAQDLRKRLDQSTDAGLLAAVGAGLSRATPPESARGELGRKYLDRALALDPTALAAGHDLTQINRLASLMQSYKDMTRLVGKEVSQAQYQKAAALPAEQRASFLPNLAEEAYWAGALAKDSTHDTAVANQDWDLARQYAKDALTVEENFRNDPEYAKRVYNSDLVLAMLAERADGNSKEARKYLLSAAPLDTGNNNWFPTTLKLLVLMLRYGNADDRAAVIEFCETQGKFARGPGINLLESAKKLRQEIMPSWYQFEVMQFPEKAKL